MNNPSLTQPCPIPRPIAMAEPRMAQVNNPTLTSMRSSIAHTVKENAKVPNFATTYPAMDGMQRILATGQFEAYLLRTPTEEFRVVLQKFQMESIAFRSAEKAKLNMDLKYVETLGLAVNSAEIKLNSELGNPARVHSGELKQRFDAQFVKIQLHKSRLQLLQQDYDIRKEIDTIDTNIGRQANLICRYQVQIKENMEAGRVYDKELDPLYLTLLSHILPLTERKPQKYKRLAEIRAAREKIDKKLADHTARQSNMLAQQNAQKVVTRV